MFIVLIPKFVYNSGHATIQTSIRTILGESTKTDPINLRVLDMDRNKSARLRMVSCREVKYSGTSIPIFLQNHARSHSRWHGVASRVPKSGVRQSLASGSAYQGDTSRFYLHGEFTKDALPERASIRREKYLHPQRSKMSLLSDVRNNQKSNTEWTSAEKKGNTLLQGTPLFVNREYAVLQNMSQGVPCPS